jgi:hypothetical protein
VADRVKGPEKSGIDRAASTSSSAIVRPDWRSLKRRLPPVIAPWSSVNPVAGAGTAPPSPAALAAKTQFACPSSLRSRLIAGWSAERPRIFTSPPISAPRFTSIDRLSARNSGWSLSAQSALAMLTGPVVTPRLGQSRGFTSPESCILRPVIASNWAETASATRSEGTIAISPTATSTSTASPTPTRMIQRMLNSSDFLVLPKFMPRCGRLPSRGSRTGIKWPRGDRALGLS